MPYRNDSFVFPHRFNSDQPLLNHKDTRSANCLYNQIQPFVSLAFGSGKQAAVFLFRKFLFLRTEDLPLFLDGLELQFLNPVKENNIQR